SPALHTGLDAALLSALVSWTRTGRERARETRTGRDGEEEGREGQVSGGEGGGGDMRGTACAHFDTAVETGCLANDVRGNSGGKVKEVVTNGHGRVLPARRYRTFRLPWRPLRRRPEESACVAHAAPFLQKTGSSGGRHGTGKSRLFRKRKRPTGISPLSPPHPGVR
ncbi:MAG: hypothetical protein BJ554DRAFT_3543, partial [Olpidium bornovanus]